MLTKNRNTAVFQRLVIIQEVVNLLARVYDFAVFQSKKCETIVS